MRLIPRRNREEEREPQVPARHFITDLIRPLLDGSPQITGLRLVESKEGPLGGVADTYDMEVDFDGRITRCRIAIYGDSEDEILERFGNG